MSQRLCTVGSSISIFEFSKKKIKERKKQFQVQSRGNPLHKFNLELRYTLYVQITICSQYMTCKPYNTKIFDILDL
jgi:hypothetical protein